MLIVTCTDYSCTGSGLYSVNSWSTWVVQDTVTCKSTRWHGKRLISEFNKGRKFYNVVGVDDTVAIVPFISEGCLLELGVCEAYISYRCGVLSIYSGGRCIDIGYALGSFLSLLMTNGGFNIICVGDIDGVIGRHALRFRFKDNDIGVRCSREYFLRRVSMS